MVSVHGVLIAMYLGRLHSLDWWWDCVCAGNGLVVEIGDRTIDLSVSAKMARMNKLLQDTL